jgi:hypothetical protein
MNKAMECWSDGALEQAVVAALKHPNTPRLHHSASLK